MRAAIPFSREAFWADGTQARVRRDGRDEPLRPTSDSDLLDVNPDGPFPNADQFRAVQVLADPALTTTFRPRVSSTTLALTWVAAGRRAAYLTDGHLRDSVHFTSGIAICQAAGCIATGLQGQLVHTGIEGLVVAAESHTHFALINLISRQLDRPEETAR